MEENTNFEEEKAGALSEAQTAMPSEHSFRDLCLEYKDRIEYKSGTDKYWRTYDQSLHVPVTPEVFVLVMALAEMTGRSKEEIGRELMEDGVKSLIVRGVALGLTNKVPSGLSNSEIELSMDEEPF